MSNTRGINISDTDMPELSAMKSLIEAAYQGKKIHMPLSYVFQAASRIITAYDNAKLVGIMLVGEKQDGLMNITGLAVLPNYQGMGIGYRLVKRAIALYGHTSISVKTAGEGASFFEKCGFEYNKDKTALVFCRHVTLPENEYKEAIAL